MSALTINTLKDWAAPAASRVYSLVTQGQLHELAPEHMLARYRQGYFPLATTRLRRITWHNPEIRAILPIDDRFHVPKNVAKLVRSGRFHVSFDRAFDDVLRACAEPSVKRPDTWISEDLIQAYTRLNRLGYAHSVEVWREGQLVGGGYGLAIGGFYSGESWFSREDHASKVGLVHLVNHLRERGFLLRDAQWVSNLTRQFGVIEVLRAEYEQLLAQAVAANVTFL